VKENALTLAPLVLALFVLMLCAGAVSAQTRVYHFGQEWAKIWINADGSIGLFYNMSLTLDSGQDIHYVLIGQPKGDFTIGQAGDQFGNVLSTLDASSGSDYKVQVNLAQPLSAGQTVWFTLTTNVAHMIYEDNQTNVGMEFKPTWFSEASVLDLRVAIVLPSGINASMVATAANYWNGTSVEPDGRLSIYWERLNLEPNQQYDFGVSFPKEYVQYYEIQRGEVTIKPLDDTYVDSSNPNSNYGGQSSLALVNWQSYALTSEKIVWLKFNLSAVPEGANVDMAELQLYAFVVSETYDVSAFSCSSNSWTELTLKYSNMPSYNATLIDSVLVPTDSKWYNWSIVNVVRSNLKDNSKSVTIVLSETSPHSSASEVSFYSKESQVDLTDYAPRLTVHWSGFVPEFPSFLFLPLAMIATLVAVIVCKKRRSWSTATCAF
jgi:hypothetical protein